MDVFYYEQFQPHPTINDECYKQQIINLQKELKSRIKLKNRNKVVFPTWQWSPTSCEINQLYSRNTLLGSLALPAVFIWCWSFRLPFVSLHADSLCRAMLQFLCRKTSLMSRFLNNQVSCISELSCCLTDRWMLKFLMINTLNKSFFDFDKNKCLSCTQKKGKDIVIHLICLEMQVEFNNNLLIF